MIESWVQKRDIGERLKPWLQRFKIVFAPAELHGLAEAVFDGRLKLPEESDGGDSSAFEREIRALLAGFDEVAAEDLRRSEIKRVFKVIVAVEFEIESTSAAEVTRVITEILERCDFTAPDVRVTCVAIDEIRDPNDADATTGEHFETL